MNKLLMPALAGGALGWAYNRHRQPQGLRGVYDPGILKAIFLAGGPGSGKSYAVREIFAGQRGSEAQTRRRIATQWGLKVVNSDPLFEMLMIREGYSPKDLARLEKEDKPVYDYLTLSAEGPRERGKAISKRQMETYLNGRLGLIIDGTGKNYVKIATLRDRLAGMGYDTSMLFVNTTLPVALERNQMRSRVLADNLVISSWAAVQSNMGRFQTLFGRNRFYLLDATETFTRDTLPRGFVKSLHNFVSSPVKNPAGKAWIASELRRKAR